jgi:hypothetical protein
MPIRFPSSTRTARAAVVACASLTLGACCCGVVDTVNNGPAVCREPATFPAVAPLADSLLVIVPSPVLDTAQERRVNLARAQATSARVDVARLAADPQALLQPGKQVVLSVSATRSFAVTGVRLEENLQAHSYFGRTAAENGEVTLVLTSAGITGGLQTSPVDGSTWSVYEFHPIGGGLHVVVCVDPTKFGPD